MNEYHVSQITTKNAMISLAEHEIVERIKGKGTFICERSLISSTNNKRNNRGLIGLITSNTKTKIEQ